MSKKDAPVDIILSEGDVTMMTAKELAYFSPILATLFQVGGNAANRQALGNLRLGLHTGENLGEVVKRLTASTLLSGFPHRFTGQFLTQGVPMAVNRIFSGDPAAKPTISPTFTALWMTAAGCGFEISGFKQPIQDKATSVGLGDIHYWQKVPRVAMCIIPISLVRNFAYSKLVFGQSSEDSLPKRAAIVLGGAFITNPVDTAVNVAAYEAAIAKDGTPITDIFRATWRYFMDTEGAISPYQKFAKIANKAFSGATLRMTGVAGAAIIFSKAAGDMLEEGFKEYGEKTSQLWHQFQERVAEHGGVDLPKESEVAPPVVIPDSEKAASVSTPSATVKIPDHELKALLEKGDPHAKR